MTIDLLDRPITHAVAIGETADVMASILDPAVQLALWRRDRPAALDWIDALEWDAIDDIDAHIVGPDFGAAIGPLLSDAGYLQTAQGRALCDEVAGLATRFAQVVDAAGLRLRLEVIETDACRKFHMDQVTARLLMPLSGPGTQWIETALGKDAPVNQLAVGKVGIFKGRLWVEEPAILHRSPPVATTGQTRLLLVLDPHGESA
ncbi:hypothetical protein NS277_07130 [Novosphingobium barchaimii]|nr:hypothetical protein NS277_07130 [Novosphingobium barchaimii]